MKMDNTNDLSAFMDQLKEWSKVHGYRRLQEAIESAEQSCFSASELILRYADTLEQFREMIPESLPPSFRENWEAAIKISQQAIETVKYEEKDRSIFSFGS
jgi:hypothetical protein